VNARRTLKHWLYGRCPGFAGSFPYYRVRVYFPPGSQIFKVACEQGIYEAENLHVMISALRPGTTVIDVGANIGLMSIPLLHAEPSLRVISVEPSPNTRSYLARTIAESAFRDRWSAAPVAVGDHEGTVEFFCANAAMAVFDGLQDTHRAGPTSCVKVPLTTVDKIWMDAGRPKVCAIKLDIEGGETAAIRGSQACLRANGPAVLFEWNASNLRPYNCSHGEILSLAASLSYRVYAVPTMVCVESAAQLEALMQFGESFLLLPK
jgi:FkbM family methyltransferase